MLEEWKYLAEKALDLCLKYKVKYAECRAQIDHITSLVVKNGQVDVLKSEISKGVGVRVLFGGVGFASTNSKNPNKISEIAKKAIKYAKCSEKLSKKIEFSAENTVREKWEVREKKRFDDVELSEKIRYFKELDANILSTKTSIKIASRVFSLHEVKTWKYYVNTDGSCVQSYVPRVEIRAILIGVKNGDFEQCSINKGASGGFENVDFHALSDECMNRVKVLEKILTEGKMLSLARRDVVLNSEIVGIIVHETVGHPYEADRILGREAAQAGESFVTKDMLGTKISQEEVTVIDDPTLENSYGYYLYDDEGVRARARYLIKNGYINEFLHNRETAYVFRVQSNGSARASAYSAEPLIRMANTYMARGEFGFDELVEDVKDGVFIKSYEEWNIDDFRYNMRVVGNEAYRIENGRLTHAVRKPVFEITTPRLYSNIDAVGSDLEFYPGHCGKGDPVQSVPVWFGGPAIRVRGVALGSGV